MYSAAKQSLTKFTNKHKTLTEYTIISFGVFLLAVSVTLFLEPVNLVTGGVSGLGITIRAVIYDRFGVDIPLWLSNIVLNTPLFLLGLKARGFNFIKKTLYSTAFFSLSLYITELWPPFPVADDFLSAVFGAAVGGFGLGLAFRYAATTGGTDLAAGIITKYKPSWPISRVMFILDAAIIMLGFYVFGPQKAMYAIVSVFICSRVIQSALEGLTFAKAAFIISDKHDAIADAVLQKLSRGATSLKGTGLFTQTDKNVILCVVSTKQIFTLKQIIRDIDDKAFVIVADVREVLGEGFEEALSSL